MQPADDIVAETPPEQKPKTIAKLMYKYESAHTPCDTSKTIYTEEPKMLRAREG